MSSGLSLLRKILDDRGPITFMAEHGLETSDFIGVERDLLAFIEDHVSRYSVIPTLESARISLRQDIPTVPSEPLQFWVDQVKNRSLSSRVVTTLNRVSTLLQSGQMDQVSEILRALGSDLLYRDEQSRFETLLDLSRAVLEFHDIRQNRIETYPVEIPFGFPYFDEVSDGMQPGDTIALVGETGVGKSYVAARIANAIHNFGGSPLLVSMEMEATQMARRILAIRTGVNETRIRRGQLMTSRGRQMLVQDIAAQEGLHPFYLIDGRLIFQVEDLVLYVQTLRPTAVIIDGAYLMKTRTRYDKKWDIVAETAERIKIMAIRCSVPILGTYQLNERREVYGGRSIKQLASIVIYVEHDNMARESIRIDQQQTRLMTIVKGRSGESGRIRISYNMFNSSIEQLEVIHGIEQVENAQRTHRRTPQGTRRR